MEILSEREVVMYEPTHAINPGIQPPWVAPPPPCFFSQAARLNPSNIGAHHK